MDVIEPYPDAPVPPDVHQEPEIELDVTISDGAAAKDVGDAVLRSTDAADDDFGMLVDPLEDHNDFTAKVGKAPQAWASIDLDQVRADINATHISSDSAGSGLGASESGDNTGDLWPDIPDDPHDHMWLGGGDQRVGLGGAGSGRPPGPPEDTAGPGEPGDDEFGPENKIERQRALEETSKLIGMLGRFTHGPDSIPLRVEDDDNTLSVSFLTAGERAEDSGLQPDSIIGRKATMDKILVAEDFAALFEAETLDEEVVALAERLDQRASGAHTAIAHFALTVEPSGDRLAPADAEFDVRDRPTAGVTLWINKDFQTDVYVDATGMDRRKGERVEAFLARLGFGGMHVPTPDDAPFGDNYFKNAHSSMLKQLNRFIQDHL